MRPTNPRIERQRNPAAHDAAMKKVRKREEKKARKRQEELDNCETEEKRQRKRERFAEQEMECAAGIR